MMQKSAAYLLFSLSLAVGMILLSCSPHVRFIQKEQPAATISLCHDVQIRDSSPVRKDSIIVRNVDGKDYLVLKTVKDENGESVASQTLQAATITARFRNVAERHGSIEVSFLITVPSSLMDSRWQLRYTPTMYVLGDSTQLDAVKITGKEYRKKQLRGYQLYQRFLDSIIKDSACFVRKEALEIFLKRNIPALYAFKNDSSLVSEECFLSSFGVSREEAVDHYTRKFAIMLNEKKKSLAGRKREKYIKVPIDSCGVRLDSVIVNESGDWTYLYTQTVRTRPCLKKIEMVLDGAIYEQDSKVCDMRRSEPLCYYVSSVSSLVDDSPHYVRRIIERRVETSMSYSLAFRSGRWELDEKLGDNAAIMAEIKSNCTCLVDDKVFQLDSISICAGASPEGSWKSNMQLSRKRSAELRGAVKRILKEKEAEDAARAGFSISWNNDLKLEQKEKIEVAATHVGEDWDELDRLVHEDCSLDETQKREYFSLAMVSPEDTRELAMHRYGWYAYLREKLYPELRRVTFNFHLHRRAMVKDTVHTTVLDSAYMEGVECIRNRDYDKAIEILRPYNDYNTAVAYCAKDYNHSAMAILSGLKKTAPVNYMLALLYSRTGDEARAVELYLKCCREDRKFVFRGNLDPEISQLIKKYNINSHNQNP